MKDDGTRDSMSTPDDVFGGYAPRMSEERVRKLRAWHEAAYQRDAHDQDLLVSYLGREFVIPPQVHPIQAMAESFGNSVLDEVRPSDRVLDMGTGCGVNAILAASVSRDVVAVDINPIAVASAKENAERNGAADRIDIRESDVFDSVRGAFDVIVFDPPFRWFKPRDWREHGTADEDYASLRTFFREVRDHLTTSGRVLLCFGTTGDIEFLEQLIDAAMLDSEVLVARELVKDGENMSYFTYRLTAN